MDRGYKATEKYLENVKGDMFTAIDNRMHGKTRSRVERVFKTVNMRVNVGKWSTKKGRLLSDFLLTRPPNFLGKYSFLKASL